MNDVERFCAIAVGARANGHVCACCGEKRAPRGASLGVGGKSFQGFPFEPHAAR
jgi:hypothetical protein